MVRATEPVGRRGETEDDDHHGSAQPLEARLSKRSSMVQSKPHDAKVPPPPPPPDIKGGDDDGGDLHGKIARDLELCISQVDAEYSAMEAGMIEEVEDADDDNDEIGAVTDTSKPKETALTTEERQKAREKREKKRKKEKKAKKKAKKEAKKPKRSESSSHVKEREATTSYVEESETSIQEEAYKEILKKTSTVSTGASSLTSSVKCAGKQEEAKEEETQKDGGSAVAPIIAPALPSTPFKQVKNDPCYIALTKAAALPKAAEPTEPAHANANANANSMPSSWIDRKMPPANGGERRPAGRSQVGSRIPVIADINRSSTSSKDKNEPRSSACAAAEPKEPARRASANSQPSSWIDRKTRPATGGERRRESSRRDSNSSTPSSHPGQPRTVDVSDKLDSEHIHDSQKVKHGKMKEIVTGDEFDVEIGIADEAPQEYIMKDDEQDSLADYSVSVSSEKQKPGAFCIQGDHYRPMQATVMSMNTSVLDSNNGADNNARPVEMDLDAPLVAHLVPENEPSYSKIVVAVEDTEPQRRRRQRFVVAGLLVLLLAVAIVLGVTLGMSLTQHPPPPEAEPDSWYHVVTPIDGDTEDGEFGSSISMCSEGSRVAVGAQGSGEVKVFELDDEGRFSKQIGQTLNHSLADMSALSASSTAIIRSRIVVELSSHCQVLAVGCPFCNVDNKTMAGQVELYKYNSTVDSWEPLGSPHVIPGADASDFSGASLALSQKGDRIAIGSPGNDWAGEDAGQVRLFHINHDAWELLGMPINGTFPGEEFGGSVSMANKETSAASVIAVGSSFRNDTCGGPESAVAVRAFELRTGSWYQLGQGIVPEVFGIDTAWFAKISSDGKRLVVSNQYLNPNGIGINEDNEGLYVAAFELDSQGEKWVPRGGNIHTSQIGKKSGYTITLSDDGQTIGMGDPGRAGDAGNFLGHVHFFRFTGDKWCQLAKILGAAPGDMTGYSLSISGDGNRMAFASPKSRRQGYEHGEVMVVALHEDRIVPDCSVWPPRSTTGKGGPWNLCNRGG